MLMLLSDEDSAVCCSICLDVIVQIDNDSKQSRCNHMFHRRCLRQAVRHGLYHCPICRDPFGEVAPTQDKRLFKYAKMVKINMPMSTVKQKMEVDGISANEIDAFFTGGFMGVDNDDTIGTQNGVIIASKAFKNYSQMLKMNIPEDAVRLRMQAARVSEEVIDLFFSEYWNNQLLAVTH